MSPLCCFIASSSAFLSCHMRGSAFPPLGEAVGASEEEESLDDEEDEEEDDDEDEYDELESTEAFKSSPKNGGGSMGRVAGSRACLPKETTHRVSTSDRSTRSGYGGEMHGTVLPRCCVGVRTDWPDRLSRTMSICVGRRSPGEHAGSFCAERRASSR